MAAPYMHHDHFRRLFPEPLGNDLLPHVRILTRRNGQVIIDHQDESDEVFVVLEGRLRVELFSLNGREIILADIGAGDLVGEYAALDGQPRSATVTATSSCTLACIPGPIFKQAVLANPRSAQWIVTRLTGKIRQLTERTFEMNALAVRSRLHCELLRLSLDAGVSGNAAVIAPAPTHAHLANKIGTHREAVTRELRYLQQQGITDQSGRTLTICDVERLAEIVRAAAGDIELIQRANQARIGRGVQTAIP
ncbi:MAG: Crp/Fnr family transcriptional regulator [Novosphingobium sp.]|nr:Crp/Fnr family transcriptional regulator [Novosphingobium sp.]